MRHTCLFLLLTMPAVGMFASPATAHDKPVLIRAQEPVVLPAETPTFAQPPGRAGVGGDAAGIDIDAPELRAGEIPRPSARLLGASLYGADRVARVVDDALVIPPLIAPTTDQSRIGNWTLPEDASRQAFDEIKPLPEGPDRGPDWSLSAYFWQAPNTWSGPLYFEDVMLERYGHERFPHHLQPLASAARFYATIPALPYLMAVRPPGECYYHLGYYRVGECAPPLLQRPPYERRAALITAGVAGGMVALP
ncbi:hypothetical protein [Candidatus Laterigemmans baculatus]|uniref:hypothetical protein n=1 Tax=Candidatus Laterigemmans baculatus TaxID=2770505 RepID=UPI0013DA26B0|nr:hypothetical protein [Candidatus Laterigemmans baculatus]